MNKINIDKIEHFLNTGFVKNTIQISILKNIDGSYELFGKFKIYEENKKYVVETKYTHSSTFFYSLQNAVTWCIFQKRDKFNESTRIYNLDKIIEGLNFSINRLNSMLNKVTDNENILIYSAKLSQDEAKKYKLNHELQGYKTQAKYWQDTKFTLDKVQN